MKPIQTNKILDFADFLSHSKIYVETGSCYGGSINRALQAGFEKIRSCEVFDKFYNHCLEAFKDNDKVKLYLGESRHELSVMLSDLTEPAVIFLDAHPAGPNTGGHDDLMNKGKESEFNQDFILTKEIDIILKSNKNHIIIIDDQNGEHDENKAYVETILRANPAYSFYFYDEQLSDEKSFYKNKSLVCIPDGK